MVRLRPQESTGLSRCQIVPPLLGESGKFCLIESGFASTDRLVLVDGNIGQASTAMRIAKTPMYTFGSTDAVLHNANIFFTKPFPNILAGFQSTFRYPAGIANCESGTGAEEKLPASIVMSNSDPPPLMAFSRSSAC